MKKDCENIEFLGRFSTYMFTAFTFIGIVFLVYFTQG